MHTPAETTKTVDMKAIKNQVSITKCCPFLNKEISIFSSHVTRKTLCLKAVFQRIFLFADFSKYMKMVDLRKLCSI